MSMTTAFPLPKTWADWIQVPPVFVIGSPRSGTTLMRLLLSSHPKISISSEGAYVYHLRSKISSYGDLSRPENLQALHRYLLPCLERVRFLDPPAFEYLLEWVKQFGSGARSLITFYGTWEGRAQGKQELAWWGDNAPYHVYNIPYFESMFPTCKYILMIRDPRDVFASAKAPFEWDINKLVSEWEKSLLDGLLAESYLGAARVRRVRYENLATAPREQLVEICEFLGVEYTEEMLLYYQSDAAKRVAELDHFKNLVKPVFSSSIGRYRQVLSKEEIAQIHHWLYSPMRWLGYISHKEYDEACPGPKD